MAVLAQLEPKKLFHFFEELSQIPHGSGNTKEISDYLVSFAKARNLAVRQDESGNVVIVKEATVGYEKAPAVILQGHVDMVCEQSPDCQKDMAKEGLDLQTDGQFIWANGTTLGGDNGIGVAMSLALLDASDIPHPRLECVFTVDEEIGMIGADAMTDLSMLQGRAFLNLDSEDEGVFTVSCAGGNMTRCTLPVTREAYKGTALQVTVSGLRGGHSGVEIHKGRANACKLLARLLNAASKGCDFRIVSCAGGLKDNAIPREATAIVVTENKQAFLEICARMKNEWAQEYQTSDPEIAVACEDAQTEQLPADAASTNRIVAFLSCAPNGIQEMSAEMTGLVQTSLNLGVLVLNEDTLCASFCLRSSMDSQKQRMVEQLDTLAAAFDGKIEVFGNYAGWSYRPDSPLRELLTAVYTAQYGKAPKIEAIHAGLECGVFAGKIPDLDCVSIGPDLTEIHTCREKADVASVARVWKMLCETLRRMK